jgi:hypothetical protein
MENTDYVQGAITALCNLQSNDAVYASLGKRDWIYSMPREFWLTTDDVSTTYDLYVVARPLYNKLERLPDDERFDVDGQLAVQHGLGSTPWLVCRKGFQQALERLYSNCYMMQYR